MQLRDTLEWLLLGALWGASFLFMRVAVPEMGPLALIEVRLLVAALFLTLLLASRQQLGTLQSSWGPLVVLGLINSAIPFSLFAFATLSLSAGYAAVLNATAPLFGTLVAFVWLRERLSWVRLTGLLLGFLGVVILVSAQLGAVGTELAVAAGLLAALCYGLAAHYSRWALSSVSPLTVSTGSLIAASLMGLPIAWSVWPEEQPGLTSWCSAVALGVACTGCAYLLYFRLLQRIGPARTMTVAYLIPVFGIFWGWLLLGEPISWAMWLGGPIVLLGTALVHRRH